MTIKKSTSWITFSFALWTAFSGYLGYKIAHSRPSLYAGLAFGIALLLSSLFMLKNRKIGAYAALFFTASLTATFIYRSLLTCTLTPSLLAFISAVMLLFLLLQVPSWRRWK